MSKEPNNIQCAKLYLFSHNTAGKLEMAHYMNLFISLRLRNYYDFYTHSRVLDTAALKQPWGNDLTTSLVTLTGCLMISLLKYDFTISRLLKRMSAIDGKLLVFLSSNYRSS